MNNIIYAGKHLLTLSVNRHTHSSWELIYCTSGSGVMQFDDFELPYKTGDIVAIPPMMPHANVSSEGFSNYHINMSDLVPVSSEPILMHDDSNAFLLNVFEAAYFHFNSAPEKRDAFLPHYGDLLVSYMSQSQHQVKVSKVVEEIQTNIIQNYPDCNYELDKFLQSFPFSYDYLRKLFKKELGITPPQVPQRQALADGRRYAGLRLQRQQEHRRNLPALRLPRAAVLLPHVQKEVRRRPQLLSGFPAGQ